MTNFKIACAIKEYLVNLAVEDKFPMDLNDLHETEIERIIDEATEIVAFGYVIGDIEGVINNMNENPHRIEKGNLIEYSDEFAEEVLNTINSKADCSIGVSWYTIEYFIDYCLGFE